MCHGFHINTTISFGSHDLTKTPHVSLEVTVTSSQREKYFPLKHTWPLSSTHLLLTSFKVTRHQTLINVRKASRPPDPHPVCVWEIEIKRVWSCKLHRQASNRWEITENQGLGLRGMKRNQTDKAENGKYLNRGDGKCKEDKWQWEKRVKAGQKSVRRRDE